MQVNVNELIEASDLKEPLYQGKRVVKKYPVAGDHKSHCMVFDWRDQSLLHVELKAGLTGRDLEPKDLAQYPVSFQARTFVDIETANENEDEEEGGTSGRSGKGGGGKRPAKHAFSKALDAEHAEHGKIKRMMIMGKEIAQEAFAVAYENLKEQLHQTKIAAMDMMKGVANIERATPGGGLDAKGNETINYKYNIEKNSTMFSGPS
ncbi:MAG: hypothetical protein VX740_09790 [Pseudomonadota bacterium]|jgi:hypothetical protein|nr:hypothetical protein [Pseudomonadota bacterium]MED5423715.1 hypothetical protein [Pseudomonadota bacterium]